MGQLGGANGGYLMIMARNGPYAAKTGHDHEDGICGAMLSDT
jgi:hypothetical protein